MYGRAIQKFEKLHQDSLKDLKAAERVLREAQGRVADLAGVLRWGGRIEPPEPEFAVEPPEPLLSMDYTTLKGWLAATFKLMDYKALDGEGDQ